MALSWLCYVTVYCDGHFDMLLFYLVGNAIIRVTFEVQNLKRRYTDKYTIEGNY